MDLSRLLNAAPTLESVTGSVAPANATPEISTPVLPIASRTSISLNTRTLLTTLYYYSPGVPGIDYPQTSTSDSIGHMFHMSPGEWYNPSHYAAYSHSENHGSRSGVHVNPLTDQQGRTVPCKKTTLTCSGSKICPFVDRMRASQEHTDASIQAVQYYANAEQEIVRSSPERDVLEATISLYATFRDRGCFAPIKEATFYTEAEARIREDVRRTPTKAKRGAHTNRTCEGRLILIQNEDEMRVQCQHFHPTRSKTHTTRIISPGRYELRYFAALFNNDIPVIAEYEERMKQQGYGPLVPCTTVRNARTNKTNCDLHHRGPDGCFVMQEMAKLPCNSKFIVYEPHEEYRTECPYVLLVCRGAHTHPIPTLSKTPYHIQGHLVKFLRTLEDLPNLTARRLIRSDAAQQYLRQQLPNHLHPTFVNLHVSLNNRDHLQAIIKQAQDTMYPMGTGWEGAKHLMENEARTLPLEQRYIRSMKEYTQEGIEDLSEPLRFVICMKPCNASRLIEYARHIQTDISFKRLVAWYEFEMSEFDRSLQATVCYLRVYINSQSAEAHKLMLLEIYRLVYEDTGRYLRFRHLHSNEVDDSDFQGILTWTVDHHPGQGKGIGQFFQAIAPPDKTDLHEPLRLVSDLGPYEHLSRILRLCVAHYYRKIQEGKYEPRIQQAMRSLACFRHPNWEQTLSVIEEGGQKAKNWLAHKENLKFAFSALCWEKSHIPATCWKASEATSNVVESSHWDILIDTGRDCSLVGGILKAQRYDNMQAQTNLAQEDQHIPRRHRQVDSTQRELRTLRRHANTRINQLNAQDQLIEEQNANLKEARDTLLKANNKLALLQAKRSRGEATAEALTRAEQSQNKALKAWKRARKASETTKHAGIGSGSISVELYDL